MKENNNDSGHDGSSFVESSTSGAAPQAIESSLPVRKPLGITSGNRFGFKSQIAAPQVVKPTALPRPQQVEEPAVPTEKGLQTHLKNENESPAVSLAPFQPAISQPSPRGRIGQLPPKSNDAEPGKFSIGIADRSRVTRARRPPTISLPSPTGEAARKPPLSREPTPPSDSSLGARKRKPGPTVTGARKANVRTSPRDGSALAVPTPQAAEKHENQQSAATDPEVTSVEENEIDGLVNRVYGEGYTEKMREILNMGVGNNKPSTRTGSRYGQRSRGDDQQTAWLRALRTALRDSLDKQKELVDLVKQHELKLRSQCKVAATNATTIAQANDNLKSQLERAEARLYEFTHETISSYSKKDELMDEHRALLAKQQEALTAKARVEGEKAELSLRLAEMATKCELLQDQLKQRSEEVGQLKVEAKERRELESSVVEQEVEMWKQKLAEAEEEHQNSLEEVKKQAEEEGQKQKLLQAEIQALKEQISKLEYRTKELDKDIEKAKVQLLEKEGSIAELKDSLKRKDSEVAQALSSFAQVQAFAQDANTKLVAEKAKLELDLSSLKAESLQWKTQEALSKATTEHLKTEIHELKVKLESVIEERKEAKKEAEESKQRAQEMDRSAAVEKELRSLLESQMRELRTEYVALNAQMQAVKSEAAVTIKGLENAVAQEKESCRDQVAKEAEDKEKLKTVIDKLEERIVELESELRTVKESVNEAKDTELARLCEVTKEADVLRLRLKELGEMKQTSIAEKEKRIAELENKLLEGETQRRKMHNLIQELRGNVRVFVRTRPILPSDNIPSDSPLSISCLADGVGLRLSFPQEPKIDPVPFTFDKVFPPSAGQDAVFDEVSEFVQSALDGYNVCLFSYGQTGSGKTHSMQGSGNGQMRGIIPRSIEKVMSQSSILASQGWKYSMQVSFLEIYNESIRDLLAPKGSEDKKHDIKRDASGKAYVTDLTLLPVDQPEQVESLMEQAAKQRSVGFTEMNAQSSRSHSVFTLYLKGENETLGAVLEGRLNLCDLAGSERLSRSQATGDRLKETQAINKSLSCLTDVFVALANKNAHVPFRNSKLTYLLQDCLSGDGKTLMMVNLSPTPESYHESLCSLRFARQVNQCELGKPKRQVRSRAPSDADDDGSPTNGGGSFNGRPPISKSSSSRRAGTVSKSSTLR